MIGAITVEREFDGDDCYTWRVFNDNSYVGYLEECYQPKEGWSLCFTTMYPIREQIEILTALEQELKQHPIN